MSDDGHVEWPEGHPGQPGQPRQSGQPGQPGQPSFPPPPPGGQFQQYPGFPQADIPSHMVWAVIATVAGFLLCWLIALPLGIAAIVYASKVDNMKRVGNLYAAQEASHKARSFAIGSTAVSCVGLIFTIIYIAAVLNDPSYFGY